MSHWSILIFFPRKGILKDYNSSWRHSWPKLPGRLRLLAWSGMFSCTDRIWRKRARKLASDEWARYKNSRTIKRRCCNRNTTSTMSATTSPQKEKTSWVKFDEADGEPPTSPGGLKTSRSSSGVSSARGSVNSASVDVVDEGGVLPVSEVQVVDEQTLKRKNSEMTAVTDPPVFKQMATPTKMNTVGSQEATMQSVNLSDDASSPTKSTSDAIRGRRFGKYISTLWIMIWVAKILISCAENGEIIVTLLPVNEKFPWITPAKFRPELVPEELMAPCLTVGWTFDFFSTVKMQGFFLQLTVEDYVQTMEKLTSDMRFTIYNICYKRILVIWIVTAFIILLSLLFSGFTVCIFLSL